MRIEVATESLAQENLSKLNDLLINSVNNGASIGWLPPIDEATAETYWKSKIPDITAGERILLLAWEGDALIGSAQLGLETRENGNHRAEVQKVMVHTDYRRRGIAQQLMEKLEECAVQAKRSLLFLDTSEGDTAEFLYQRVGFTKVGVIPNYVRYPEGELRGTAIYYKILS